MKETFYNVLFSFPEEGEAMLCLNMLFSYPKYWLYLVSIYLEITFIINWLIVYP